MTNEQKTCEHCHYWMVGPFTHNHYLRYCQNKMVKRFVRGIGSSKGNALFVASFGCRFWKQKQEKKSEQQK